MINSEDNTSHQNKNFNTPGLFILLVDQSGSMWGNSIQLVKKALLSFIEIIPKGSYFHLLGFGSHLKKYSEEPVEYNKDNIEKYKAGRTNVVDYLVGQVMKKTRGQANPSITRSMMIEEIEKR